MNAYTLHLAVLQPIVSEDREPTQVGALCNPQRTEVVWNDTFTAFRLVALKWWDDASYIAYQARDIEDRDDDFEGAEPTASTPSFLVAPLPAVDSDEIPF